MRGAKAILGMALPALFQFSAAQAGPEGESFGAEQVQGVSHSQTQAVQVVSSHSPFQRHLQDCKKHFQTLRELERKFSKEFPQEDKLGSFLTWVWDKDCEKYPTVMRALFQETDLDNDEADTCGREKLSPSEKFPWLKNYRDFSRFSGTMQRDYFSGCELSIPVLKRTAPPSE